MNRNVEQFLALKHIDGVTIAIVRALMEHGVLDWDRADHQDESAGFSADLDVAISAQPEGNGHTLTILINRYDVPAMQRTENGLDLYPPEEITVRIPADLYDEIERAAAQAPGPLAA